jgi:ABC-type uncharacterized transport system permease subunit
MSNALIIGFKASFVAGLIYGIGTIGLSLIYRYLKFPDLTTFMTITVGGVAVVTFSNQYGLFIGLLGGMTLGAILGLITALQIAYCKIPPILAGIITNTAGFSLAFLLNNNDAQASFEPRLRDQLDWVVNNIFSYYTLVEILIVCILIALIITLLFMTRLGSYVFSLLGSEHYLEYRHRRKVLTLILLIAGGNALIGLTGAMAAIQNNTASIPNHPEFLHTALGGYVLGSFIVQFLTKLEIKKYLARDNKPASSFWVKPLLWIANQFRLNEEDPLRIFYTLLSYILATAVLNWIFKTAEIWLGGYKNYNFAVKALVVFGILLASNFTERISKISN